MSLADGAPIALARATLDPQPRVIPPNYTNELLNHLSLNPEDTNFRCTLTPGSGYGTVKCREIGCGININLDASATEPGGGLAEGFGSLAAYRKHIEDHPTHRAACKARVRSMQRSPRASPPDPTTNTSGSKLSAHLTSDHTVPRKRHSDIADMHAYNPDHVQVSGVADVHMSPKRPRTHMTPSRELLKKSIASVKPPLSPKKVDRTPLKSPLSPQNDNSGGRPDYGALSLTGSKATGLLFPEVKREQVDGVPRLASLPAIQSPARFKQEDDVFMADNSPSLNMPNFQMKGSDRWVPRPYTYTSQSLAQRNNDIKHDGDMSIPADPMAKIEGDSSRATFNRSPVIGGYPSTATNMRAIPTFPPMAPLSTTSGSNVTLDDLAWAPHEEKIPSWRYESPSYTSDELPEQGSSLWGATSSMPATYESNLFDSDDNHFGQSYPRAFSGAQPANFDDFLKSAGNVEYFDGNESVEKALQKLKLPSLHESLPGMNITLLPHQVIGLAWMLGKEESEHQGGIMADEMGLGKTVQLMSLIVKNPSPRERRKTTLLVLPASLLDQWKLELETKTNCGLSCYTYYGPGKTKRLEELRQYDVVITSHTTLALEWIDPDKDDDLVPKRKQRNLDGFVEDDSDNVSKKAKKSKKSKKRNHGLLYAMDWYRVVIDEAQSIRNKRTRLSKAVAALESQYRWLLTGTPIVNSLEDAYSYMRFLRIRPWYEWEEFHPHISRIEKRRPDLASQRLQAIFNAVLLRRKKDSLLDGKRLIELPEKTVELFKLEFSADEREIYNMVEAKSQEVFNRYLRAGTVLKNYATILVMLLRLRQICSHPALVMEEGTEVIFDGGDTDEDLGPELARARRVMGSTFVANMQHKMKTRALERIAAEKESADASVEDEECPICFDHFTEVTVTGCTHAFCHTCIINVIEGPPVADEEELKKYKHDERPCPVCRSAISKGKLFPRTIFEPTDKDLMDGDATMANQHPEVDDTGMPEASSYHAKRGKGKASAIPKKNSSKTSGTGKSRKSAARRIVGSDDDEDDVEIIPDSESVMSELHIDSETDVVDSTEDDVIEISGSDDQGDDDLSDFIVESDEDEDEKDARRKIKKRLSKGKRQEVIVIDSDEEDADIIIKPAKKPTYKNGKGALNDAINKKMPKFLPSTKMKHMMEQIKKWAKENPGEKTMVVSQWTSCLALVSNYLSEQGISHVKFQGDMRREERDRTVRAFMTNDKAQILLMSLKCGGVGLNLTRANRVISLDLGWSEAVEAQAFDRVHRLGQVRPVFVNRLVIADTVENRVLELQERKRTLADGSLGEGSGKKIGRLSVRELANLFGLDHRGQLLESK